ncbi:MAG: hypothetical protein ACW99A_20450, partial [Candidatus Kariarchaeaceae archaeon]
NYVSELIDNEGIAAVQVYYYDVAGQKQILDPSHYTIDTIEHKISILNDNNILVTPNEISEFWVSFIPELNDYQLFFYQFGLNQTFNPITNASIVLNETLALNNWKVINGELYDVIPNLNSYYYINESESTFHYQVLEPEKSYIIYTGYTSQISAFLEEDEILMFNLTGELDPLILNEIRGGNYGSLFIKTMFGNYDCLESLKVELYDTQGTIITGFTDIIPLEELLYWNFDIKVDLPSVSNDLESIQSTPIFGNEEIFDSNNAVGIPRFEFIEWNSTLVNYTSQGYDFMIYELGYPLFTEDSPLDIAYLFNDKLQYLNLPGGISFNWTSIQYNLGDDLYYLHIPNGYIDPDNPTITNFFEDGDKIMLRYNSPVNKTIQMGIEKMYFHKKPVNYDSLPVIAECLVINTNDTNDYDSFTSPYSYNITLQLTPFNTEHLGTYMEILIDLNLTTLENFAVDWQIDFSHIVFSVPNPAYELTLNGTGIVQSSLASSGFVEETNSRIWQFTNIEEFTSSIDPSADEYDLTLEEEPLYYNDADEGRWLEFVKIYDENYNYYSVGISGDEFQLIYNPASGNLTWNPSFDRFHDYWGMQIELPAIIEPNTTLFFEYCTNSSWKTPIQLDYQNVGNIDLIYNYNYLLTPRYEEWYGEIVENNEYDYEAVFYYSESFSVYESVSTYSYQFEVDYDFTQDFINLSLYEIVGLYANFSSTFIENNSIDYTISFDLTNKNITITDLNSADGLLNQFDLITVIVNYSYGPLSSRTEIVLSNQFNQSYLFNIEDTFYDYLTCYFDYQVIEPSALFFENSKLITSDATSFNSIDFTRNDDLSVSNRLSRYNESELYLNFEIFEDPYHVMYVADIDSDGIPDYMQQIDTDGDGEFNIVMYGLNDRGEPLWYHRILETETYETDFIPNIEEKETQWFDIDDDKILELVQDSTIKDRMEDGPLDYDMFGRRAMETTTYTETTRYVKTYNVIFDDDGDGYADRQVIYQKARETTEFTVLIYDKTILAGVEEEEKEEKYFKDDLTFEHFETGIFPASIPADIVSQLTASYVRYDDLSSSSKSEQSTSETLTFVDWDHDHMIQMREYKDAFDDRFSFLNLESELETYNITDYETGEETEVHAPLFVISPEEFNLQETWGVDNVPIKFDALTILQEGIFTYDNLYEKSIIINIPNRYNLFHDYLKTDLSAVKTEGTAFKVEGAFITPPDQMVYYTS